MISEKQQLEYRLLPPVLFLIGEPARAGPGRTWLT